VPWSQWCPSQPSTRNGSTAPAFPRGLTGAELTVHDRLLAAAVAYNQLLEPRPDQPALDTGGAADRLRQEGARRTLRRPVG